MALKEDARYKELKKEVEREMGHLRSLYSKLEKYEKGKARVSEAYRIRNAESELKKKFPGMEFDRSILKLVGIMPYKNPASKDKELISRAIAENYE